MRPAQEGYIAGEPMVAPQNSAAEIEKLVDSGQHRVAVADIIPKVNNPIPLLELIAYCVV